jgi:putative transposase
VRAGEAPGDPRVQGAKRSTSFTDQQFGNGATLDKGFLVLAKIGRIAVRGSRPIEGTPTTVTIAKEADGWYGCCACAEVPAQPLPRTGRETGSDVGVKVLLITSAGAAVEHPRHRRKAEKHIKQAQRRVSRRKTGSKRRQTAVALLKRTHQQVKRQRQDFHHKTALKLLRQDDAISLDDLRVANLVRNRHLSKSLSDAGWAAFRTLLEGKAVYAGRRVVAVPPADTSQDGSGCGTRIPKSLSVRTHIGTSCGLVMDRDEHAARNMQWAGQARRGVAAMAAAVNRASPALEPGECQDLRPQPLLSHRAILSGRME